MVVQSIGHSAHVQKKGSTSQPRVYAIGKFLVYSVQKSESTCTMVAVAIPAGLAGFRVVATKCYQLRRKATNALLHDMSHGKVHNAW